MIKITKHVYPQHEQLSADRQQQAVRDVATILLFIAPAALALILLISKSTGFNFIVNWQPFLLLFVLHQLFTWLDLSKMFDARVIYVQCSHGRFLTWSAVLVWGVWALWIDLLTLLIYCAVRWRRYTQSGMPKQQIFVQLLRQIVVTVVRDTLIGLIAFALYQRWGGVLPTRFGLFVVMLPALYSLLVQAVLLSMMMVGVYALHQYGRSGSLFDRGESLYNFSAAVRLFYLIPLFVGVIAAGFYGQVGLWGFTAFWVIIYALSLFVHLVYKTAVQHKNRAYQLYRLEQLAREMLQEPADNSDLPTLLAKYVPLIFEDGWVEIRLFPNHILFAQGDGWIPQPDDVWDRVGGTRDVIQLINGLPEATAVGYGRTAMLIPIVDNGDHNAGGIYIMRPSGKDVQRWDNVGVALAAQIAADLNRVKQYDAVLASQAKAYEQEVYEQAYQAEVYAQALAYEKVAKELAAAGQIQETFLPQALPEVFGWQIAVTLEPARETSGDFYDFISLPNGRLGLVVADVADKGMGAALYMALSRTLIRIFAAEHETAPELALKEANRRILADTSSDLFVTVFYAILEPESGLLTYCNAGHTPPYIQSLNGAPLRRLTRTALPVGLFEDMPWEQAQVRLAPGDVLVMYSDGVTEAEDEEEAYFGEERLMAVTQAYVGRSAEVIENKVVTAVIDFVGDAPQLDDITLMILSREVMKQQITEGLV